MGANLQMGQSLSGPILLCFCSVTFRMYVQKMDTKRGGIVLMDHKLPLFSG